MAQPQIGAPAPPIKVGAWIAGRPEADRIAGRNVVLEFWGTHCGPCVAAIAHLNALVDRYGSDRTLFIWLSQDTPDAVVGFLEKRPLKGAVAVDQDGRTFTAYGVTGIPHTALIDARGVLRWHGHPDLFTDALLATFLESDEVPLLAAAGAAASPTVEPVPQPRPMYSLTVNPNTSGPGGFGYGDDGQGWGAVFTGCGVPEAIRYLLDELSRLRMRVSGSLPAGLWDIEMRSISPLEAAVGRQATIAALCGIFGITLLRVTERKEGWTLTCPRPRLTDMSELGGGMSISCSSEKLSACNITLDRLLKALEPALGIYLRDETGLAGKYDITVPVTSAAAAREALDREHGILCRPSAWNVEMVVLQMPDGAP